MVSVKTARQKIRFGGIEVFERPRHVRYRGSTSNTVCNTGFYVKCQYARSICLGTIRELQPRNIDSAFDKNDYNWVNLLVQWIC